MTKDKISKNCDLLKRPVYTTMSSKISGRKAVMKTANQKRIITTKNWLPVLCSFLALIIAVIIIIEIIINAIRRIESSSAKL